MAIVGGQEVLRSGGGFVVRASLGDAGADPSDGTSAVRFEVELTLEGVVDGLDELADRLEQFFAGARGAVAVGRAQQAGLGVATEQALGDGQGEQFGVGQLRLASRSWLMSEPVV
jgi:hypothetical protein